MDELTKLLNQMEKSYFDFIDSVLDYASRKPERLEKVLTYIKKNQTVTPSDVIKFISDQPDFYEDSAFVKVG